MENPQFNDEVAKAQSEIISSLESELSRANNSVKEYFLENDQVSQSNQEKLPLSDNEMKSTISSIFKNLESCKVSQKMQHERALGVMEEQLKELDSCIHVAKQELNNRKIYGKRVSQHIKQKLGKRTCQNITNK